ncbi:ATP-binding protein [Agrobacterium larrymoorei]|nr:ATP-binding protein [Agrobacterium larrymoorei]
MLFHLLSELYERTIVVITTDFSFGDWASVFGDAKDDDRAARPLTHHCHILDTGTTLPPTNQKIQRR